jgi:2-polyprenyl-6-hydroxyphenyl methylase/3-demethylubiquinone-9 3-methyltransferase
MNNDLLNVGTHFSFGENWADFAQSVDEDRVRQAELDLTRIVGDVRGKTFLDIGCGSGIHSVAAARLGALVTAVDLDPMSVETARAVTRRFAANCNVSLASVFDIDGRFDVVYSWGVLHHTGAMWNAVAHAAGLVAPGGRLALALYARTPFCDLWRVEKKLYTASPKPIQAVIRGGYKSAFVAGLLASGRNPIRYIRTYQNNRGMRWHHDVHDWLGGYPYESATPEEVAQFIVPRGFDLTRQAINKGPLGGLLGTGCNEYLFTRGASS